MRTRNEIEEKFKWDLSGYCKSNAECYVRLENLQSKFPKLEKFKGKLNTKENIFTFINFSSEYEKELGILGIYSHCKLAEDNNNNQSVELSEKTNFVETKYGETTSFFEVELCALSDEFLTTLENDVGFKDYSNIFREIKRQKKHILSEKEEKLISNLGTFTGGFSDTFSMFDSTDIKFEPAIDSGGKKHELNLSTYLILLQSKDAILRESAYKNMIHAFANLENTLATNYTNQVKMISVFSKIRGYETVLEQKLYNEEISKIVYQNLIKKVKENVEIISNYYKQKQKLLCLKTLKICDVSAPIGKEITDKIPFEKGFELIKTALTPLGENYLSILDKAKAERWMDLYDNKGKDSGQFQVGAYRKNPLVFLRYNDDIDSVSTTAHELGHAIHTYYSNKNQPFEKADYPIFLAEIASTVNEVLLSLYLIKNSSSNEQKIYYYDQFFDLVRGTIFRQTQFAEFEEIVFDKYQKDGVLSKKFLLDTYENLSKKYYGNGVEILPETKYEYSRIPHFYYGFYVYKYATGLISAILICKKILESEKGRENYIKFLSSGDSLPPLETLKIVGVNLENEKTFDEAFEFIKKMQKSFENLTQNQKISNKLQTKC